jgi:hypothetical protein
MVIEGVLRAPGTEGQFETGWALYQALARNSRLYLMSAIWTEEESATWLRQRNLTGHLGYLYTPLGGTPAARIDALQQVRTWRISLVIEPDPACAAAELAAGWHTLLHTHAAYSLPEWRPDYIGTPRPWDELTDAIDHQRALRAADSRTDFTDLY